MLALSPAPQQGDWCWRTDLNSFYSFLGGDATNIANWAALSATAGNFQVNGALLVMSRLNLASVAASTTTGDVWQDSTQATLTTFNAGVKQYVTTSLLTATATATTSGTSASTMLGGGIGTYTLPANFFVVGKTVRLKGYGTYTTTGTPGTSLLTLSLGGTTVAVTPSAVTLPTSLTNQPFEFECVITCRSVGSSGTVFANGSLRYFGASAAISGVAISATAATTINTTASQAINLTQTNSVAGGTVFSTTNTTLEVLN
jgi:hypothetical protein